MVLKSLRQTKGTYICRFLGVQPNEGEKGAPLSPPFSAPPVILKEWQPSLHSLWDLLGFFGKE